MIYILLYQLAEVWIKIIIRNFFEDASNVILGVTLSTI